MKAIGIVRRIDDLGRVVLPEKTHRTMRIRARNPLLILNIPHYSFAFVVCKLKYLFPHAVRCEQR